MPIVSLPKTQDWDSNCCSLAPGHSSHCATGLPGPGRRPPAFTGLGMTLCTHLQHVQFSPSSPTPVVLSPYLGAHMEVSLQGGLPALISSTSPRSEYPLCPQSPPLPSCPQKPPNSGQREGGTNLTTDLGGPSRGSLPTSLGSVNIYSWHSPKWAAGSSTSTGLGGVRFVPQSPEGQVGLSPLMASSKSR